MATHDRVGEGALTPIEADALTDLIQTHRILQSRVDAMTPADLELLPVLLTDYDSDSMAYSWIEQAYDGQAVRYDKINGLFGSPDYLPAYTPNGEVIAVSPTVGVQAFIKQSSTISVPDTSRGMAFEIVVAPPAESCPLIVLTGRTYSAPAVGPPYYQYTGTEVVENATARYSPGSDITIPIFHQNLLLPLPYWTEAGSTDDIPPEYVVRVCKGLHSECYIITDQPRWEPVAINANPSTDGIFPGVRASYNQLTGLVNAIELNIQVVNYNALVLG